MRGAPIRKPPAQPPYVCVCVVIQMGKPRADVRTTGLHAYTLGARESRGYAMMTSARESTCVARGRNVSNVRRLENGMMLGIFVVQREGEGAVKVASEMRVKRVLLG